jgi:hypothetical protein
MTVMVPTPEQLDRVRRLLTVLASQVADGRTVRAEFDREQIETLRAAADALFALQVAATEAVLEPLLEAMRALNGASPGGDPCAASETVDVSEDDLARAWREGSREYDQAQRTAAQSGSLDDPKTRWWLHRRELPDGRVLYLEPHGGGFARLALATPIGERLGVLDDEWHFRDLKSAWHAVLGWNGRGDPVGWYRHPGTGRRRPDGTAESEHIQW